MTEGQAGRYTASVAPFHPHHGPAHVEITISCQPPVPFDIYIDPSGVVRNTVGNPIIGATVTLYRSDTGAAGSFAVVPDGDAIMSPSNRDNPDTTDAVGHFGWDVIAGFYVVRAEKPGCADPNDGTKPYVETPVLEIPPPVTDLELVLSCGTTAVSLRSFSASRARAGIWLRWRTASETQTLGFNLYRRQRGKLVKLNRALMPSAFGGTTRGRAYSFLDRSAQRGGTYTYRLQAVGLGGSRVWIGTVVARRL
jgi:hypothetical protein